MSDTNRTVSVNVRFTEVDADEIYKQARASDRALANWVAWVVRQHLAKLRTASDQSR